MSTITIAGHTIGGNQPPYLVAEMSANHGGSLERALATVDAAHRSGADALKLQTYTPDGLTIDEQLPDFKIEEGPWKGRTLYDLYEEAHLPVEWHEPIFRRGRELGITVFSAAFHEDAVDLLEELDCPAYKIASFELVDIPLIRRVAATGKPIIMSTGMATAAEIASAVHAAENEGAREIALLHCVSSYPAPTEEANLLAIPALAERFDAVIGLSDHTLSDVAAIGAIALGAAMVEKHFTLDRNDAGPDTAFSLTPDQFQRLVEACTDAWRARGDASIERTSSEEPNLRFRRSLYVVRDMEEGETFDAENVRSIRPGFGLPPQEIARVIGRKAARTLRRGTALKWDDVSS